MKYIGQMHLFQKRLSYTLGLVWGLEGVEVGDQNTNFHVMPKKSLTDAFKEKESYNIAMYLLEDIFCFTYIRLESEFRNILSLAKGLRDLGILQRNWSTGKASL